MKKAKGLLDGPRQNPLVGSAARQSDCGAPPCTPQCSGLSVGAMLSKEEKTEQPNSEAKVFRCATPIADCAAVTVMGVRAGKSESGALSGKGGPAI